MAESSIILVHGSFFSSWTWLPVIERLINHDVEVTAIELPLTSLAADADVLRKAIATASKTGPVTVVCHSYTGHYRCSWRAWCTTHRAYCGAHARNWRIAIRIEQRLGQPRLSFML